MRVPAVAGLISGVLLVVVGVGLIAMPLPNNSKGTVKAVGKVVSADVIGHLLGKSALPQMMGSHMPSGLSYHRAPRHVVDTGTFPGATPATAIRIRATAGISRIGADSAGCVWITLAGGHPYLLAGLAGSSIEDEVITVQRLGGEAASFRVGDELVARGWVVASSEVAGNCESDHAGWVFLMS